MSILDWLQIALGFTHVVRRLIAKTASLVAGKIRPRCATVATTAESAD